ncbi:hypothetical protein ACFFF5_21205 [Lederbergia wuyishanensis]|uniref:Uncharacterized protein n=1 Tax=Lederbergia wuyishanensis TaxID=1347903 RepID=A0ABU0D7A6_9BACI|nr:hypothetical protein [Lederbergia wuyishanensis]MCJ8008935.1 hypothetical protein [Lederbergia wuyishanensis]MDQ0344262.1 hypothetical protein [Lederbergia wuyishanensis]
MDLNTKYQELGHWAKTLLDLHNEDPNEYRAEKIVNALNKRYLKLGFKPREDE